MTLGHKMFLSTLALLVSLLVIIASSLLGIGGLSRDLDSALVEYGKLGAAYGVGVEVDTVRALLNAGAVDDPSVLPRLASAQSKLRNLADEFEDTQAEWPEGDPRHPLSILRIVATLVHQARSDPGLAEDRLEVSAGAAKQLGSVLDHVKQVIEGAQARIERTAREANAHRDRITTLVVALSAVLGLGAVVISVGQYRGVMSPMRWLREGVREIAAGQFTKRLETRGDREFVELAQDFNRMASELDGLYRDLEEKVRVKSRELVRSERLASVGFLAAGVAHEINNPLGIITGYSELTLRRLEKAGGLMDQTAGADEPLRATGRRLIDETSKNLTLICEEAFRCKKITQKLLTLARGQVEARAPVAMEKVASHVAEIVRGLPRFRGKEVEARRTGGAIDDLRQRDGDEAGAAEPGHQRPGRRAGAYRTRDRHRAAGGRLG